MFDKKNENEIPAADLALLGLIMRNLSTVLRNTVLYPPTHPIAEVSVGNLKGSIDKWFIAQDELDIGASPDKIIFRGVFLDDKDGTNSHVAGYLHSRGISGVSFQKDIEKSELMELFKFLRRGQGSEKAPSLDIESGGFPELNNIDLKPLDYSSLLEEGGGDGFSGKDEDVWNRLTSFSEIGSGSDLPRDKKDFIMDLLKDPKRSAAVLNKAYRDAIARLEGEDASEKAKRSFAKVLEFLSSSEDEDSSASCRKFGKLLSRLDPGLLEALFAREDSTEDGVDLYSVVLENMPENFVDDFLEDLASGEGVNEHLLKVFEKFSSAEGKEGKAASLIADKIIGSQAGVNTLSEMQMFMKEVLTSDPSGGFMSQVYNLTVDAFTERKMSKMDIPGSLVPIVKDFNRSFTNEKFKREKAELLLNLLWAEKTPENFEKLSDMLLNTVPSLLKFRETTLIKDIFSFFFVEVSDRSQNDPGIYEEVLKVRDQLKDGRMIRGLVAMASRGEENTGDVLFVMEKIKDAVSAEIVVDEFCREKDLSRRDRIAAILKVFSNEASESISLRVASSDRKASAALYTILNTIDNERACRTALELIERGEREIKEEILDQFVPLKKNSLKIIEKMALNGKDAVIRRKAFFCFLRGQNTNVGKIFRKASLRFIGEDIFTELLELSGESGTPGAVPYLSEIALGKWILRRSKNVRITAVVSLGKIGSSKAIGEIEKISKKATGDLRGVCETILRLARDPSRECSEHEENDGDKRSG